MIWVTEPQIMDNLVIQGVKTGIITTFEKHQLPKVLLHFGGVAMMSSTALGLLIVVQKKLGFYTWLKLCCLSEELREILRITELDRLFEIHQDMEEAMAAFGQARGTL